MANAREKAETYRDDDPLPGLSEKAVVVDDGVATGATARAFLNRVNAGTPERAIFAVFRSEHRSRFRTSKDSQTK